MECTTNKSIEVPAGRGPKLGEGMGCAVDSQPCCQVGLLLGEEVMQRIVVRSVHVFR